MTAQAQSPSHTVQRRGFAMMLMIVSSVIISFGGLLVRNIEAADAWQINLYRSLALMVAIFLILCFQYRSRTLLELRGIGYAGVWAGAILAVAGIAFMQALTNTTVANTMFTLSAIPFITAGLARLFLSEVLSRITVLAMVTTALGIIIMVMDGTGSGSLYGNGMALITATSFSAFAVIVRANRHVNMLPALLMSGLFVGVVALVASLDALQVTLHDLLLCLFWGGVMAGIGNGMFIIASRHLVAAELTLFMLLEFALSPLWVWMFVGESPTSWALVGGSIVISSVAIRALIELRGVSRPIRRGRPSPS
ncbi:MAG: DMT family transporter [Aestuariivirgaceae bacterium]